MKDELAEVTALYARATAAREEPQEDECPACHEGFLSRGPDSPFCDECAHGLLVDLLEHVPALLKRASNGVEMRAEISTVQCLLMRGNDDMKHAKDATEGIADVVEGVLAERDDLRALAGRMLAEIRHGGGPVGDFESEAKRLGVTENGA